MSDLALHTRRSTGRRFTRPAILMLLAAALIIGGWLIGASLAPSAADLRRAQEASHASARSTAHEVAVDAAYIDAWEIAFAQGAVAGREEGIVAGQKAAAVRHVARAS